MTFISTVINFDSFSSGPHYNSPYIYLTKSLPGIFLQTTTTTTTTNNLKHIKIPFFHVCNKIRVIRTKSQLKKVFEIQLQMTKILSVGKVTCDMFWKYINMKHKSTDNNSLLLDTRPLDNSFDFDEGRSTVIKTNILYDELLI